MVKIVFVSVLFWDAARKLTKNFSFQTEVTVIFALTATCVSLSLS